MIRNVWLLARNDLAIAFKNRTIYLLLFVPLFVFFVFSMVDRPGERAAARLGLIDGVEYGQDLAKAVEAAPQLFKVSWVASEAEGRAQLTDHLLDGMLVRETSGAATLVVVKKDAVSTLAMLEGFTQLQRAAEARADRSWVTDVRALTESGGLETETFPTWVLMLVLLVGFLVLPPQIAEEKEKKLIHAVMQAPVREGEWLAAKIITGIVFALTPIALLHAVSGVGVRHVGSYVAFLLAGSFCFCALGVLLGFLCKTQGSARALGVVFYLPHLLPSALADFSKTLETAGAFVPSYQFFVPMKAMLVADASVAGFGPQLLGLVAGAAICCALAHLILSRRWLM